KEDFHSWVSRIHVLLSSFVSIACFRHRWYATSPQPSPYRRMEFACESSTPETKRAKSLTKATPVLLGFPEAECQGHTIFRIGSRSFSDISASRSWANWFRMRFSLTIPGSNHWTSVSAPSKRVTFWENERRVSPMGLSPG